MVWMHSAAGRHSSPRTTFRGWLSRGVWGFCAIFCLTARQVDAQFGDAAGLDSRPFTLEFMISEVTPLILDKREDYNNHRKELRERSGRGLLEQEVQRLARGDDDVEQEFNVQQAAVEILDRIPNADDRYKFFRGAEVGDLVANYLWDIQTIIGRLLSCMKIQLRGVCLKFTCRFLYIETEATVMVRYSFPSVKIETVDHMHKTGYIPKALINVSSGLRDLAEDYLYYGRIAGADLPFKPFEVSVTNGLERAQGGSAALGGMFRAPFTQPSAPGPDSATALSVARDALFFDPIDRNMRGHTRLVRNPGHRNVEYHLMPEFFNQTVGNSNPWCHEIRNPYWFSDWPLMMLPARYAGLSMILWPSTMIPMTFFPQVCAIKNATDGKTPWDLSFPLAFPDVGGIIPGQDGCIGENAGPWLPVTNTAQSVHFTDASRVGTMKAVYTANRLISNSMYTYQPNKGDKFQWTRNDRMPKGCAKIEKWKLDEEKLANSTRGNDSWNVSLLWTRFQCCLNWRSETQSNCGIPIVVIPPSEADYRFY